MRLLAFIAIAVALTGCATKQPVRMLSVAPVAQRVTKAQLTIAETKAKVQSAETSVDKAEVKATELLRVAPVDLRPLVESLKRDLISAKADLVVARQRAVFAESELEAAQTATNELQKDLITQAEALNKAQTHAAHAEERVTVWRRRTLKLGATLTITVLGAGIWFFRKPLAMAVGLPPIL